eukprot:4129618-Lingulodinium_polyedra.AAC.1
MSLGFLSLGNHLTAAKTAVANCNLEQTLRRGTAAIAGDGDGEIVRPRNGAACHAPWGPGLHASTPRGYP